MTVLEVSLVTQSTRCKVDSKTLSKQQVLMESQPQERSSLLTCREKARTRRINSCSYQTRSKQSIPKEERISKTYKWKAKVHRPSSIMAQGMPVTMQTIIAAICKELTQMVSRVTSRLPRLGSPTITSLRRGSENETQVLAKWKRIAISQIVS